MASPAAAVVAVRRRQQSSGQFSALAANPRKASTSDGRRTCGEPKPVSVRWIRDMSPKWVKNQLSELGVIADGSESVAMNRMSHGELVAQLLQTREKLKWQLLLRLVSAQHLPKMDLTGAADPYVTIETHYPYADDMQGQTQQKSKTIKNSLNPQWDEEFVVKGANNEGVLHVTVWDWNRFQKDEVIGEIWLRLADLSGKSSTTSFNIRKAGLGLPHGTTGRATYVFGQDGEESTITLFLSASNVVDAPASRHKAYDDVPVGVAIENAEGFSEDWLQGQIAAASQVWETESVSSLSLSEG